MSSVFWPKSLSNLTATLDAEVAYHDADDVVIVAPTNYDSRKYFLDTSAVETVIRTVMVYNLNAVMVIKFTIPVGYMQSIHQMADRQNLPKFINNVKENR